MDSTSHNTDAYPLAGRTMDQLYGIAGPPQGEEQAPLYPQRAEDASYPCPPRIFCGKKEGGVALGIFSGGKEACGTGLPTLTRGNEE